MDISAVTTYPKNQLLKPPATRQMLFFTFTALRWAGDGPQEDMIGKWPKPRGQGEPIKACNFPSTWRTTAGEALPFFFARRAFQSTLLT